MCRLLGSSAVAVNVRRRHGFRLAACATCAPRGGSVRLRSPPATWAPSQASTPPSGAPRGRRPDLGGAGAERALRRAARRRCASPTSSSAPTRPPGSACERGGCPGLDAFAQRRLYARGNLDLALGFEGLFRLPGDRPPLLRVTKVETAGATISSLISGKGADQVDLPARAGVEQDLVLRDDRHADARTTRCTPSTCPGSDPLRSLRAAPTTPPTSPARCSATWTRWRSSERTWSATRWAAGSRSSWRSPSPTEPRRSASWPRCWPSAAAASWSRW